MAVNPQKREDLLRDARQFPQRVLFHVNWPVAPAANTAVATEQTEVFIGVRSSGGWSIYFGEDPVLQFNERNELRRLYFREVRYAAAAGNLELLKREERGGRVVFERQRLETECERDVLNACQDLMAKMVSYLESYLSATDAGEIAMVGQFPESSVHWLDDVRVRVAKAARELVVAASLN